MIAKDAIQEIQNTAVKANGARIIAATAEPSHVYYKTKADGEIEKVIADAPPINHYPTDFRSVVALASDSDVSSLWCSTAGVIAVLSEDGRDKATLDLNFSQPFAKLREWAEAGVGGVHLDQLTVYSLFRSLFRNALAAHPTIRDDVRKVDINKAQQAAGEVSRTAVSMSRKLIAEASGADKLPEVLTFKVPVFAEAVATVEAMIEVAFDLDPNAEKFRFIVLPNEIEAAISEAEAWVERQVTAINEHTIPVFRGTP